MKSASAMKYGGELVDAVDCDYDSFKELIPLCPNCKEPVFLRAGGQRKSVKGKDYKVPQHWCHFDGTSKEQVAGCELRVNGYTEKDRAKIANQARGQRLKLLQRWFWDVYKAWTPNPTDESFEDWIKWFCQVEHRTAIGAEVNQCISDFVQFNKDGSLLTIVEGMFLSLEKEIGDAPAKFGDNPAYQVWTRKAAEIKRFDYGMHKKMTSEIFEFLCSRKNRNNLLKSVFIVSHIRASAFAMTSGKSSSPSTDMIGAFLSSILTIPWASEFQRLETEAKQRKGAA